MVQGNRHRPGGASGAARSGVRPAWGQPLHLPFWAPKEENARREVFENTKAYNQGTIQEVAQAYKEYNAPGATDSQKAALKAVVLHQTADFDTTKMPPYLAVWIGQLRQE